MSWPPVQQRKTAMSDFSQTMPPSSPRPYTPSRPDLAENVTARAGEAKEQVSSLAEKARAKLSESIEPVADKAKEIAEQQKIAGAQTIGGIAGAVHRAADDLETQLPGAAGYVHEAAERLERASAALNDRSIDDLIGTLGQFARDQPVAFFGTSVLAGFVLS